MTARSRSPLWFPLLALLLGLVLLVGCGGGRPRVRSGAASGAQQVAPAEQAGSAADARDGLAADLPFVTQAAVGQGVSPPAGGAGAAALDPAPDRKIILNADISLRVENARDTMARLQSLADFNRGYIVDARLEGTDEDGWTGQVVMRIPAANYHAAIAAVRELGTVEQERQYSQDVTDQYYDLETRIRIATEYEQQLRELAQKAGSFEEWLKLSQQINEVRVEIENLTGKLRRLQNQVEYSTLNVAFRQPPAGQRGEERAGLWGRITHAFRESSREVWEFAQALIVWLVALIPGLAFLAALALLVALAAWPFWRRSRRLRSSAPGAGMPPGAEPPPGPGQG
ncbi:MAG: DUF4349 domain-containing protein [Firmicutes bacterium]|nr:DUF4349 domain-containing protein [Bacillota bacterium]